MSILSSCTIFAVFWRPTPGELSSSAITSSIGRPLMPPEALMRSAAICSPTTAVLPPAAPAPDSGCSEPILNGWGAPKAARHGADPAAAPADQGAARDLAAIPDVFGPFLVLPLLSHRKSSHWSCGVGRKTHPASVAGPGVGNAIVAHSPLPAGPWRALGGEFVPLANAILGLVSTVFANEPWRHSHSARV